MNKPLAISIGLGLLVVFVLFSTTYSVSFHEAAVKKRFGQPEDAIVEPGLQFKLPIFADQVSKYDTRLQILESGQETISTADGQQVIVRAFLLWRVDRDRVLEFDRVHRSLDAASSLISDSFKTALLAGLSRYRFDDLIGPDSRLEEAESTILAGLGGLRDTGIAPVSVGISHVQFPPRTSQAVVSRMEATRRSLAISERSKGEAEAQRIDSEARTMADRINAFAAQRAAEIRALGDQDAAVYIAQMAEEPELAVFLMQLEALEMALSERTTLILESGYAPMHILNFRSPLSAKGVPQPSNTYAQRRADEAIQAAMLSLLDNAGNPAADNSTYGEEDGDDDVQAGVAEPHDPSLVERGN